MPATLAALTFSLVLCSAVVAEVVEVKGKIENPVKTYGRAADYRLVDDTTFGWRTGRVEGDLDIAGHRFTMNTGGGNTVRFAGAISGDGTIIWQGGGPGSHQRTPSFLQGDQPNTFYGALVLERGLLALAKPPGVDAIAGPLTLGGKNWAGVRWDASHQVADMVPVKFTGGHISTFDFGGASETLGALALDGDGEITLGEGDNAVIFADSSAAAWRPGVQLIIHDWQGGDAAGDRVCFGDRAGGLTQQQLAQVGFMNPSGHDAGLYRARMLETGALVPGEAVEAANPAYDLSPDARQARQAICTSDGLEQLAEAAARLDKPMRVTCFGDSITWLGGYIKMLEAAVKPGGKDAAAKITFINRGINGGGVRHLRDGAGGLFNQDQPGLADVLEKDQPDIAAFFIGVNDVNVFRTDPDEFRTTMTQLIQTALDRGITPIVVTPMLVKERPDGANARDKQMDRFAAISLDVAKQLGVAAVDLRGISIAYLKNHNYQVRLDGSVDHRASGILTTDGVHPTREGNRLIAAHLADAIAAALK